MDVFAQLPGAVSSEAGISHFGDPVREQRALAEGDAVVPRADRLVVSVGGPDRLTWLDSITSQAVSRLAAGESTELLVLDPQGRIEHAAAVLDDGETTWLIADAPDAAGLAAWLGMMRFRSRVEVALRPELAVIGFVRGGAAERTLVAAASSPGGLPLVWADPWGGVRAGGWQYAATEAHPGADYGWAEALVAEEDVAQVAADRPAAGLLAAEALRVAAWRPRWTGEVDERSIPHEADWLRTAVHLDKGCYRGQETVAKVHNLGHPPRRLVMLHLDGSDSVLPERGAAVFAGDAEAGRITSSARHHELGPIALAIVSRRTPPGETLTVEADGIRIAAAQEVIVPGDAGATADVPRLTRLSRRPLAR
ncbi:glycine cleavage T C-terminal barrel domain-containing protein [Microbacterium betulae]|uniref:Glycine cleavage T C-terminal barrel domain-containing protein n=1 Tax=Microbacterium betulae TaxID=2981139 RepID=A0AA97FKV0_9MICO|nr:glycine cleavage T C-terminal barrel domain-containing protein [Microbacterium sp. AB]WOF24694.1 glycine cleavage T C-terminal barrel domain-containing protein [Microbacterium sp. AB]